ncbi:MAG: class I SAM-dependent methyltransferase [Burkholderiales bacterium]|jgi:SAM-dependent methyltransferase|nr:class I SAM-dependent methyltransferase [Burkholderiales bacterium]
MAFNSTQRFSNRVADYVRYRPNYPAELVTFLHETCGVPARAKIADIGAGTGISTKLLLDAGHPVVAVEPNDAMRQAADQWLSGYPNYSSIAAPAEQTTLPDASVDLVTAAQAFHWFDREGARREFARILRPGGLVALFWNIRLLDGSDFLRGYETLLRIYGVDYSAVAERYSDDADMQDWFGSGLRHVGHFHYAQKLDFDGLRGRLLSSSYVPQVGHPNHEATIQALRTLFDATAQDGVVDFEYDTRIYVGSLS